MEYFDKQDTCMHTDTACVQHVNVGLTQARPNYYLSYVVQYAFDAVI